MNMWKFILYSLLGTVIWNTVLIYLGALAGENWQRITDYANTYAYILGAVAVAVLLFFIVRRLSKIVRRRKNAEAPEQSESEIISPNK